MIMHMVVVVTVALALSSGRVCVSAGDGRACEAFARRSFIRRLAVLGADSRQVIVADSG